MGLPQELVDMIFWYLRTDWDALTSCSLTCRAFFCSARRVIHELLHISGPRMFPLIIKLTRWCWFYNRQYFRVLSLADDAALVQYTRHLVVDAGQLLTPRSLRPYVLNLQKYVWLTSLTLTRFDPTPFLPTFDHYFHHLSQSLRTMTLILPQGTPGATRDFIDQFQNLDNLEFDPVPKPPCRPLRNQPLSTPRHQFPSLSGRLCIINTDSKRARSFGLLLDFPCGIRFHSLQFVCSTVVNTAEIVEKCSSTLESVLYTFHCQNAFADFDFKTCFNLRVFEARVDGPSCTLDGLLFWLAKILSTIKSPVFSKLILSLDKAILEPHVQLLPERINLLDQWTSLLYFQSGTLLVIKGDLPLAWRQLLLLCLPYSATVNAVRFDFPDPSGIPRCGRTR